MVKTFLILVLVLVAEATLRAQPITIYLAGDSTMAEKLPEKRPETGWGEKLQQFFRVDEVIVSNHAKNGRSTRTFIEEKRWDAITEKLKAGDYVFIQFGHNDESKEKVDRYTSPADFRRNLSRFVEDVRSKQATPVLLTPVMRRRFDQNGNFYDTHGEYPDIIRGLALETKTLLIDMHRESERLLKSYGPDGSKKLFLQLKAGENLNYPNGIEDNTHFSPLGADEMARLAVAGIKGLRSDLANHLKSETPPTSTTQINR
jgi:lysophospholipase L1-like esterase